MVKIKWWEWTYIESSSWPQGSLSCCNIYHYHRIRNYGVAVHDRRWWPRGADRTHGHSSCGQRGPNERNHGQGEDTDIEVLTYDLCQELREEVDDRLGSEQGTPKSIDDRCPVCAKYNSDTFTGNSANNRCACGVNDQFGLGVDEEDEEVKPEGIKDPKVDDPNLELFKRFQQLVVT